VDIFRLENGKVVEHWNVIQPIPETAASDGSTLAELVAATGCLPHTTRAALAGLRKRGYAIAIDRTDKPRGSVYRIEPTDMSSESLASSDETACTDEAPSDRPDRTARQRSRQAA